MNYDDILGAAQLLTYGDKLRLAQNLIQLARNESEGGISVQPALVHISEFPADSPPCEDNPEALGRVINPNRPWVGADYPQHRIFVLGESYTGTYEGDLEYDDAYIGALLAGEDVPGPDLFEIMAEKLEMSVSSLWHRVIFTNLSLGSIGATSATKVTPAQLRAGRRRLESLLRQHKPKGVLILGVKTGDAAAPVCTKLGIAYRTVYHPSGVNNANPRTACTAEMLQAAWRDLACLETSSDTADR